MVNSELDWQNLSALQMTSDLLMTYWKYSIFYEETIAFQKASAIKSTTINYLLKVLTKTMILNYSCSNLVLCFLARSCWATCPHCSASVTNDFNCSSNSHSGNWLSSDSAMKSLNTDNSRTNRILFIISTKNN